LIEVYFFPFIGVHNAGGNLQSYYELGRKNNQEASCTGAEHPIL
jgi:hypothetical protein